MKIAKPGHFDISAGHVAVEAGGGDSLRIERARLHIQDDGSWRVHIQFVPGTHAPEAEDVEVNLTGDLYAWTGRGRVIAQGDGTVELESTEPLTVVPAVGA